MPVFPGPGLAPNLHPPMAPIHPKALSRTQLEMLLDLVARAYTRTIHLEDTSAQKGLYYEESQLGFANENLREALDLLRPAVGYANP